MFEEKMASENMILTEAQLVAMERRKETKETYGEIETEHTSYLQAHRTARSKRSWKNLSANIYRQYAKVTHVKLYNRKNAIVATNLLNDLVIPFFDVQEIPLLKILTDRGKEYCGRTEYHEYELYLAVENIDHSKTKAKYPQTN